MSKFVKIGFWIAGILIVLLACTSLYLYSRNKAAAENIDIAAAPKELKQKIVKQYQDSLTRENHTKFTNSASNLPGIDLISKPLLDTISKSLDIKSNQVTSYMKISQVVTGEKLAAEKSRDSLQRIVYNYRTKYIALSFTTPDSTHKSGEFGYKYSSDIKAVQYNPKKFLGLPIGQEIIDISSTDPNATINGLEAFSIKPRERFFGAELQGLTQYNVFTKNVSPGLGVQLRFGRVYVTGAQYFTPSTGKANTLVGARVAIFKL